jgi:hypothetical protein
MRTNGSRDPLPVHVSVAHCTKQERILHGRLGPNLHMCPPSPACTRQVRRQANGDRRPLGLPRSSANESPHEFVQRFHPRAIRYALCDTRQPDQHSVTPVRCMNRAAAVCFSTLCRVAMAAAPGAWTSYRV